LSLANNEESEDINAKKQSFEMEREDIERMRYEIEAQKAHVRTEILKMDEFKSELAGRQKTIENMRFRFIED
jgi:hypothetical protein